ncbi:MAG: hypothetical protein QOJ98_2336, partial [Acidobacteriota bacterium]|nr:hypothetical protein [Acidobacteriota bacterium]
MSDFLQGLVLRAAGLPLTATAAPRELPPAEPVETAPDEESTEVTPLQASSAPSVLPVQGPVVEARRAAAPEASHAAPPEGIDRFELVHERTREVIHDRDVPPQAELPAPTAPPAPPVTTGIIERETIVEHASEPERGEAGPSQLIVQPAPPAIEVPRETIVEREAAAPSPAAESPEAPRPVVLQPIVLDQTRTIVEPLREERTIVETHTERIVEPAPRRELSSEQGETEPARAIVEPRVLAPEPQLAAPEADLPVEEPRSTPPAAAATSPEAATPRTLVLAPPPIPEAEQEQREQQQELAIHIGTIEIRAAAPPPPPASAPAPVIQRAPAPPSNFDDYSG